MSEDQPPPEVRGHAGAVRGADGVWRDRFGNFICRESWRDAMIRNYRPAKSGIVSDHFNYLEED